MYFFNKLLNQAKNSHSAKLIRIKLYDFRKRWQEIEIKTEIFWNYLMNDLRESDLYMNILLNESILYANIVFPLSVLFISLFGWLVGFMAYQPL